MFRRKDAARPERKHKWRIIALYNGQSPFFCGPTPELPVKEEALLRKSMEIFADPEPCMIHRSAVLSRIVGEFELWLDQMGAEEEYACRIEDIPPSLLSYLDWGSDEHPV